MSDTDDSMSSIDDERKKVISESTSKHLAEMQTAIVDDHPPYCTGTVPVDPKDLLVFYSNGPHSGRVDFSNPTDQDLERLMQACDPAKFGHGNQDVYDESIRKAGKLDTDRFATKLDVKNIRVAGSKRVNILDAINYGLLRGSDLVMNKRVNYSNVEIKKEVNAELYKLNVYGKDGFFKSHKDTPRSTNMFGSLVIVLPTQHKGGELIFRHNSKEWKFDSAAAVASAATTSIAYTAFYSDVEHEVLPVQQGYRVTLTFNLYYKKMVDKPIPRIPTEPTIPASMEVFKKALEASLADEDFLPKGGMLGFGLQHLYPVFTNRWAWRGKRLVPLLKGVDALVLSACVAAGLRTRVCFLYERSLLVDDRVGYGEEFEENFLYEVLAVYGGTVVGRIDKAYDVAIDKEPDLTINPISWVTKQTTYNVVSTEHMIIGEGLYLGNEAGVGHAYAHLVVIADVGPLSKRQTYVDERPSSSDRRKDERDEEKEIEEERSDLGESPAGANENEGDSENENDPENESDAEGEFSVKWVTYSPVV